MSETVSTARGRRPVSTPPAPPPPAAFDPAFLARVGAPPGPHTPIMQQFLEIKASHPDRLVLFRLGDFYEFFYSDAREAGRLLNLTQSFRGESGGQPIPMAGVPFHSLEPHLARLVKLGRGAVIVEQMTEAGEGKGPIRREVTRVITPGTATDDALLDPRARRVLAAVASGPRGAWGLSWVDLAAGQFRLTFGTGPETLAAELARVAPQEWLAPDGFQLPAGAEALGLPAPQPRAAWRFDAKAARARLAQHFGIADLKGFGVDDDAPAWAPALAAAGVVAEHLADTGHGLPPHIARLTPERPKDAIIVDARSRRNLEITEALSGRAGHSLLETLDRTATGPGARALRALVERPLADASALEPRLDALAAFQHGPAEALHAALDNAPDIERITGRIALGTARPRDLTGLADALNRLPAVLAVLDAPALADTHWLARRRETVPAERLAALAARLIKAFSHPAPLHTRDGGVFQEGFDADLDRLRGLSSTADAFLADLETRERRATGIDALKVAYNKVHGFYIECGKTHAAKIPPRYHRRQTLTNVERYITDELKSFEDQVLSARERAIAREKVLYEEWLTELKTDWLPALAATVRLLADADALASMARVSEERGWTRPVRVPAEGLRITDGRHPVVEGVMGRGFTPNSVVLADPARLLLITGPNMGGKSTYMRQTALIVWLAAVGCFVPAARAEIGPIDRVHTRIGAADDLAANQSTFMMEMSETAAILHHATTRSLVVLDEIGRGTSTRDGLALARAVAEWLGLKTRALTLFATHYFELTSLAEKHPEIANAHLAVADDPATGGVAFLHQVRPGPASRSYGLHVAALAGVPKPVVARAQALLERLGDKPSPAKARALELDFDSASGAGEEVENLFPPSFSPPLPQPAPPDAVREALAALDPDTLTPRAALDALYRLKGLATDGGV